MERALSIDTPIEPGGEAEVIWLNDHLLREPLQLQMARRGILDTSWW
jgi:hypothetical protein